MRKAFTIVALALYAFMMVVKPWILIIHGTAITPDLVVLGPFGCDPKSIGIELIVNTFHVAATVLLLKSSIIAMLVGEPVTARHKRSTLYVWTNEFGREIQGQFKASQQPDEIPAYSIGYKLVPMKRIREDMLVLCVYLVIGQLLNMLNIIP